MSTRTAFKWVSRFVAVSVLALGTATAILLFTDVGTRFAWRIATGLVPGLSAEHVEGQLADGLLLTKLVYETDSMIVELNHGQLNWQLRSVLFEQLRVSRIALSGLKITQLESELKPPENPPLTLPELLPLPVHIAFEHVEVVDFHFYVDQQSPSFEISSAVFRGELGPDNISVQIVTFDSPLVQVSGSLESEPSQDYATDSKADWLLRLPDMPRVEGSLALTGNTDGFNYVLTGKLRDDRYGDVSLTANGTANLTTLQLQRLTVEHAQSPARLEAEGSVRYGGEQPVGDFELEWAHLQWPLPLTPDAQSDSGNISLAMLRSDAGWASVSGTIGRYSADVTASISAPHSVNGEIKMTANGTESGIDIDRLELEALGGVARGTASISWLDPLAARFSLTGRQFNPGEIFPLWPGDIRFAVSGTSQGHHFDLDQLTMGGLLRGKDFKLRGALGHDGVALEVHQLALQADNSHLSVNGSMGDKVSLEWNLQSPNLGELWPYAGGKIDSKGSIRGDLPWPKIEARMSSDNVQLGEYSLGSAELDLSVDLLSRKTSVIKLDAQDVVLPGLTIDTVELSASGTRDKHGASLQLSSGAATFDVQAGGGWLDGAWQGAITRGQFSPGRLANWELVQPHRLHISEDHQRGKLGCWVNEAARVCLQGERSKEGLSASVDLKELPFAYFQALLPEALLVRGDISGYAEIHSYSSKQWSTKGVINTSPSTIGLADTPGTNATILSHLGLGTLSFEGDEKALASRISLPIDGGGGAEGHMAIQYNGNSFEQGELTGELAVDVPDIKVLAALSPELLSLTGRLKLDTKVSGTPAALRPHGALVLSDGTVQLATPGILLTEVELSLTGDGRGGMNYRGQALSGGGLLQLQGSSGLDSVGPDSTFEITGSKFEVWNSADARVTASPQLRLALTHDTIDINGDIGIPVASITPQELPSGATSVSPDQVVVLPTAELVPAGGEAAIPDVQVRVGLQLGDQVELEGFGFKGRIEGELAVLKEPEQRMVASGELKILEGEYRAYGQGLVIERGQILFAGGAIDNPGISIRAVRRPAPDVLVGVLANGELRSPEVSIFSEPSMGQSEQLSWLVLGRSIQHSSGAESDYIAQAALLLGMKGGNFLTKNIGENIGLDSVSFEAGSGEAGSSSTVNQAALVLGKYLTPELYISYGLGLLDSLSTVKLRYLMTDRWSLVTESSAIASGGDITYSFEK